MGGTRFMVQWEEHPSHLATRLGQLLEHQTLVDVTLMCNTHTLRVHRAVLAACSPYFESILQRQLGAHPLIVLKDMQFSVLKSLIEFMYCGETSVTEDNLGSLLQAAKFFQVKGLSSMTKEALGLPNSPVKPPTVNGETVKKGPAGRPAANTKRIGMQTTLVSTAEVMNKQISASANLNTISTSAGSQNRAAAAKAVKVNSTQAASNITTDTAQLLLNLSGTDPSVPAQTIQLQPKVSSATTTQSRPLLQMSSRNVRVSNLRGSNLMKIEAKSPTEKPKLVDGTLIVDGTQTENADSPRKRGRPLKKQINVMFQEKVMTDTEIALQKEADASRLALEALKKEMNTDDSGDSTVTAELVASDSQDELQSDQQQLTDNQEQQETLISANDDQQIPAGAEVVYQVAADGSGAAGNVTSYMDALKEAGLPTDLPILLDSGDGSYVTVNEEVLMNICNGGVLHYQVAEGNLVHGMDGQVLLQEGENDPSQEAPQQEQQIHSPQTRKIVGTKSVGKRSNRVVTPAGGCGYTTARQIVKASMDKYRQEQAGIRKFVVKEMQAAELILEPEDSEEIQQQSQQHEELLVSTGGQDQDSASLTVDGHTLVQDGGQVRALLQSFDGDGDGQQEMVYLVTENPDEVITGGAYGEGTQFVVADGSTVEGTHTFSLADGSIVVQEGQVGEDGATEMSVEQALEAMMGSDSANGNPLGTTGAGTVVVSESGEVMAVTHGPDGSSESIRLVLSQDADGNHKLEGMAMAEEQVPVDSSSQNQTTGQKLNASLSLDDLNQATVSAPSKDIPLAVGLLPTKTALERIHSTPVTKSRSASISGQSVEGVNKRKADSESDVLEKRVCSEASLVQSIGEVDRFDLEDDNVPTYDQSLGVITDDGLKEVP